MKVKLLKDVFKRSEGMKPYKKGDIVEWDNGQRLVDIGWAEKVVERKRKPKKDKAHPDTKKLETK